MLVPSSTFLGQHEYTWSRYGRNLLAGAPDDNQLDRLQRTIRPETSRKTYVHHLGRDPVGDDEPRVALRLAGNERPTKLWRRRKKAKGVVKTWVWRK